MQIESEIIESLLALVLFSGLIVSLEICVRLGREARKRHTEQPDQLATIQGAMLGLLALLLGFSFALVASRFSVRADLIVDEANAIGTAWLRCDLLPEAQSNELHELLRRYTAQRVAFYDARNSTAEATATRESEVLQGRMWAIVLSEAKSSPVLANQLLPPFNEMFDLHSTRLDAARRHLPFMLMGLLIVCSGVSVAAVGYGCGVAGKRNVVMTTALIFLIAAALWAILDMDHPTRGLIRVGQQPMLDLKRASGNNPASRGTQPARLLRDTRICPYSKGT
jgi:hypothetical protein